MCLSLSIFDKKLDFGLSDDDLLELYHHSNANKLLKKLTNRIYFLLLQQA